jgi:erythromycin 3''-O-methyltransferase
MADGNPLMPGSPWLNLGYWAKAVSFQEAASDLAMLLAYEAGVAAGDLILDAGCGLGAQDKLWIQHFAQCRIVAIDNCRSLIEQARTTCQDPRISFKHQSATEFCYHREFDRVLALESAMHFAPRRMFLAAAREALRPGGFCAFTDLVTTEEARNREDADYFRAACVASQIPEANICTKSDLENTLAEVGFRLVHSRSLRPFVIPKFLSFAQSQVRNPSISSRLTPEVCRIWENGRDPWRAFDYVVIVAMKA